MNSKQVNKCKNLKQCLAHSECLINITFKGKISAWKLDGSGEDSRVVTQVHI